MRSRVTGADAPPQLSQTLETWLDGWNGEWLPNLVIGSGYGGAVAALRLAKAGEPVVVFERGGEFLPGDFPNHIGWLPKYVRAPALHGRGVTGSPSGLFEWHVGQGVVSLTGQGIGGGSLINAGVLLEPDADVLQLQAWPDALRSGIDDDALSLRSAFARARETLGGTAWPPDRDLPKSRAIARIAARMQSGAESEAATVTIDPGRCTACGDCVTGCNVDGAKLTLRDTYLQQAVRHGAVLVSGAAAYRLWPLPEDEGPGWALAVLPTEHLAGVMRAEDVLSSPQARVVQARRLILAAGTFGSTELLQRSQALAGEAFLLSPLLGQRFSANGDSLSFLVDEPEAVHAEGHGAVVGLPPVGPTITRVISLRRHSEGPCDGQLLPLHDRLVIEDGAMPGALQRLSREMLATAYTLAQTESFSFRRPRAAVAMDPLASGAMAEHTQVLLAMGHDGARGHLVWVPERDITAPHWPQDAAALATYQRQAQVFAAAQNGGGVHLHPPTWQLLSPGADRLMSGPRAQRQILTVHPLGGCPMGDDPSCGVVDHRGRVWQRGEGPASAVWPGLYVLDGSIVPTSLGVNPLLTITALAERAMAHLVREEGLNGSRAPGRLDERGRGGRPSEAPHAPAAPQAPASAQPETISVALFERLTCAQGDLEGLPDMAAELRLEMGSQEWLAVWDRPHHRVQLDRGRLRLQTKPVAPPGVPSDRLPLPQTIDYDVVRGHFDLLPAARMPASHQPAAAGRRGRLLRAVGSLDNAAQAVQTINALLSRRLPLLLSWLALRGLDDLRRTLRDRATGTKGEGLISRALSLARGLAHAGERRTMHYRLELVRRGSAGTPERLLLLGCKRIGYAAGWASLLRWAWQHGRAAWSGRGVPPPRPSFWQQITSADIVLLEGHSPGRWRERLASRWPRAAMPWAWGRFHIDPAELLAQAPLILERGDLTAGIVAQAAYPMLFLRYALKTHLLDLRLPDYADRAVADRADDGDVLEVDGQRCVPRRHRLLVRRGRSEGENPRLTFPAQLELVLWHYTRSDSRQPMLRRDHWYGHPVWRARSVLLLHAFGQSGAMFTLPSVQPNLAQQLLAEGFDVWILEHRISTRLPYTEWPSTIDQIARLDIPAAVNHILRDLRAGPASSLAADDKLQIFAFAQCIGGAALAMALLDGRLSHGSGTRATRAAEPVAEMPMLAGAVISQTHPFLVGTPLTRAKTWIAPLLRNLMDGGAVPLAARGPVAGLAEAWFDRVLASLPVPADEHCPRERHPGHRQDDCATCRRIRFIEAPLFKHRNLDDATHADLPRLFGPANLHLFAHASLCVEHERLVDNDGRPVYVHDERLRRHFGLPIAFLHGTDNQLFDPSGAVRSAVEHARLFPDLAARVEQALGGRSRGAAWLVDGFEHVDVIIGRDAPAHVFAPTAALFHRLWEHVDRSTVPALQRRASVRAPRAGPWIGDLRPRADGRWSVRVAFLVDDRFSDGKSSPEGAPGTRSWAWLRCGRGCQARVQPLALENYQPSAAGAPGYRIARGEVVVDAPPPGQALLLRGFSLHEALAAEGHAWADEFPSLHPTLDDPSASDHDWPAWCARALAARARAVRRASRRCDWLDPVLRKPSPQRREARALMRSVARLSPALLAALRDPGTITFAASCCRYPGVAIDQTRVDSGVRECLAWAQHAAGAPAVPAFALMMGDLIYADATAGLVDEDNPLARFAPRHAAAMARGMHDRLGRRLPALGDLLASMPVYFTQDDHEYRDGWPGSGALEPGREQGRARERRVVRLAADAVQAFQMRQMPDGVGEGGNYRFEQGPVRFFVLDTRGERRLAPRRIVAEATWRALGQWLQEDDAAGRLNCLVSGSVVLPRLAPGHNPANPGEDTMVWSMGERERLLALLAEHAQAAKPRRFLLLSGDYHLSAALTIQIGGRTVGAAVVAPPLYAPLAYANTPCEALWMNEDLQVHGLQLQEVDRHAGSGFATLQVQAEGAGWRITLVRWLRDHVAAAPAGTVVGPAVMHLP